MDNPRRNTLVLCEGSCWDTCLGERRHWQCQKLTWASCHIAKITLCRVFKESIIALHILSEQTNAAFDTPSQQVQNQEWTNMLLPQTYSPPSLVDSVEEKPAEEIDEDDPDHEIDCDLPDLLYDDKVCSEDTVHQCTSCIHCMYSFCFFRERSLFTAGGGGSGGLAKLVTPPKKLPRPPSRIHGIHRKQISPHPHDTVRKFLSTSPPPAYFKSMPLCVWVLIHVMSLSQKKNSDIMH